MIMPDMIGRVTYDRLKGINPDIKVLLSSGYSINARQRKFWSAAEMASFRNPLT
jgi:hypothetical protein